MKTENICRVFLPFSLCCSLQPNAVLPVSVTQSIIVSPMTRQYKYKGRKKKSGRERETDIQNTVRRIVHMSSLFTFEFYALRELCEKPGARYSSLHLLLSLFLFLSPLLFLSLSFSLSLFSFGFKDLSTSKPRDS